MNSGYLTKVVGITKLFALVTCLLAAAIGASAFVTSAYNKSCRNGDNQFLIPGETTDSSGGSDLTSISSTTQRTRPTTNLGLKEQENVGQNTEATEESSELKDMAPVLWMERFQISITWMGFIGSLILLISPVIKESIEYNKFFKAVNFGFHFVFCVLLLTSAIFMAYATVEIDKQICQPNGFDNKEECQKYKLKMSAAALTLLTAVLYAVVGTKVISSKLYEEV